MLIDLKNLKDIDSQFAKSQYDLRLARTFLSDVFRMISQGIRWIIST